MQLPRTVAPLPSCNGSAVSALAYILLQSGATRDPGRRRPGRTEGLRVNAGSDTSSALMIRRLGRLHRHAGAGDPSQETEFQVLARILRLPRCTGKTRRPLRTPTGLGSSLTNITAWLRKPRRVTVVGGRMPRAPAGTAGYRQWLLVRSARRRRAGRRASRG